MASALTVASALAVSASVLVLTPRVRADAERPAARLEYRRDPGAERCPDEDELRDAVSARLGYVPFREEAPRVTVRIAPSARGLVAILEVFDAAGTAVGERRLRSPTRDCDELARGVALALSVAIDPVGQLGATPPEDPPPAGPPDAAGPTESAGVGASSDTSAVGDPSDVPAGDVAIGPAVSTVPDDAIASATPASATVPAIEARPSGSLAPRIHTSLAVEIDGRWGTLPTVHPAAGLRFGVQRERLRLEVAASYAGRSHDRTYQGEAYLQAFELRAVACGTTGRFVACGAAAAAPVFGRGASITHPRHALGITAAVGAELGVRFERGRLESSVRAGIDVALRGLDVVLDGVRVYRSEPVAARILVTVGARLR